MADEESPRSVRARRRRRRQRGLWPPPDALGSLPLDVLDNILSRLHIHEVVRTSALSRAWRRRWEALPTVDLLPSPDIAASDVDALLLRRAATISSFRLVASDPSWSLNTVHDWLFYICNDDVQDLVFPYWHNKLKIPSCLFSCRELTSLSLSFCCLPHVPVGFAGFSNLKVLYLFRVDFQSHGGRELATLIAASPVLAEVTLVKALLSGDGPDDDWVIRAPNLRRLIIGLGGEYGGRTEILPRLEEGCLFGPNYAKFLMGMAQVTKLSFYCNSIWSTEVDVLERLPFLFENLRSLVLQVNYFNMSHILAIFCLLRSAPVLEELDIWGWSKGTWEIEANDEFLNAQWIDHMFAKLHVVRMRNISCRNNEMHFIEFVLSKARVLQVLSITLAPNSLCSNKEAMVDITEYARASPDAQVIFMGRELESAIETLRHITYGEGGGWIMVMDVCE
ncbi:hypothetical protein ABZP36_026312 [Zizania latifolia]